MSARDLLAARMLDDDGGVRVDHIGPDLLAAIAELDELAALKARRCDGCAWATPLGDPEYIACRREGDRPVDWYCADFTPRTAS